MYLYLSVCLVCLSASYLSVGPSVYSSVRSPVGLYTCLSLCLSL